MTQPFRCLSALVFANLAIACPDRVSAPDLEQFKSIDGRLCDEKEAPCPPTWRCITETSERDSDGGSGMEIRYCVLPCKQPNDCGSSGATNYECLPFSRVGGTFCSRKSGNRFTPSHE